MNMDNFLNCGCFMAIPSLNKVWALTDFSSFEKNDGGNFAFYKNNFFLTEKYPWFRSENHYEMDIESFTNALHECNAYKPDVEWNTINQDKYKLQFDLLKEKIKKGALVKGVPFTHQTSGLKLSKENIVYLLTSLFNYKKIDNVYLYGFWDMHKNCGFMGASPELLFTQKGNYIETYALAGTVNHNKVSNSISSKIMREHNLVIDGIKEDLAKFGEIKIEKTALLKLEKFSHLKSILQIQLKEKFDYTRILSALHPTPALGAFPKKEGFDWLYEVEERIEKRFDYCSPFGLYLDNKFSLCIGIIRCLQWANQSLKITAGGGVIEESVFEDEWEEICMKIDSVKSYFAL